MRVGRWHILGPKSHVSLASLVGRILAMGMEIWNHECGPLWLNFAVFAIRKSHCHVFLGGLDPGQAPLKTLLLMLRQT